MTRALLRVALAALLSGIASAQDGGAVEALPLGVAQPTALSAKRPLYLYGSADARTPLDSLTVREGPHHVEIASAPPWLSPEVVRMDDVLVSFHVVGITRQRVEVVVHDADIRWPPSTMWLDREAIQFIPWATYWLQIHSVETPEATPIYASSSDASDPLGRTPTGRPLLVLEVRHDWMRIALADATEAEAGPLGWIRWHDGAHLRVRYAILG